MNDENNNPIDYWPLSGVKEGDDSQVLTIKQATPLANGHLTCTYDARIIVYGRRKGVGASYVDLYASPIDLSGMPSGMTEFEVYAHINSPIDGRDRIPVSVVASVNGPADWLS